MKREFVISVFAVLLVSSTAAIYNPNNSTGSGDGDLRITKTASVPSVDFSQGNGSCSSGMGDNVSISANSSDSKTLIDIEGSYSLPNPCYELNHDISEENGSYSLNITANSTGGVCVQCVGNIDYQAQVVLPANSSIEVYHGGDMAGEYVTEENSSEENNSSEQEDSSRPEPEPEKKGLFQRFLEFLGL